MDDKENKHTFSIFTFCKICKITNNLRLDSGRFFCIRKLNEKKEKEERFDICYHAKRLLLLANLQESMIDSARPPLLSGKTCKQYW